MSELSRPFQVGLVLVLAFAALWFVALRKHSATPAPTPTHAANSAPSPHKSAIPGGLGRAVDKANAAKAQGDAAAATASRQGAAPGTQTGAGAQPAITPAKPSAARAGAAPRPKLPAAPRAVPHALPSVTPAMVRNALRRGDAVALLFYSPLSSDDLAVRAELPQVDRRGGRVAVYGVGLNGLARFKNVLRGIQIVQSPTVVVMARGAKPRLLEGYTDHAEIDQATLLALTSG